MSAGNTQQSEFWNGDAGRQWVADQELLDALLSPLSQQALQAANPQSHEHIIDIGCGCGTTTLELASRAAHATGVDLSAPMVQRAVERGAGRDNVAFVCADASRWQGEAPAQLAFSRFGVMFFDDPVAAFTNIRGNIADDGRLCFICWRTPQDNAWLSLAGAAAAPYLPEAPAAEGPNPFAFADTEFVGGMLTAAGFRDPQFALCEATLNLGAGVEDAIGFLTRIGPLSRLIAETDGETREQALEAVRQALAPAVTSAGVQLGASTWIVTANAG